MGISRVQLACRTGLRSAESPESRASWKYGDACTHCVRSFCKYSDCTLSSPDPRAMTRRCGGGTCPFQTSKAKSNSRVRYIYINLSMHVRSRVFSRDTKSIKGVFCTKSSGRTLCIVSARAKLIWSSGTVLERTGSRKATTAVTISIFAVAVKRSLKICQASVRADGGSSATAPQKIFPLD